MRRWRRVATVVLAASWLLPSGCAQSDNAPEAVSQVEPIWDVSADNTLIHRPSGLTAPQTVGAFAQIQSYSGEWQEHHVLYATGTPDGTVRVDFSGLQLARRPVGCLERLDRMASRQDQWVEFKERLETWRTIAPLFPGMEIGRAATFAHRKPSKSGESMQSEIYILCGAEWSVQYRADHPQSVNGGEWIEALIAATASSTP